MARHTKWWIGLALIIAGLLARVFAMAGFASNGKFPPAIELIGDACFFGWWILIVGGVMLAWFNKSR
jgi:hypothetical protein